VGSNRRTSAVQLAIRYLLYWRVCAARGNLYGKALDVVLAASTVHRRGVDYLARAAVVADVDVFCADVARAHMAEPKVLIYPPTASGVGCVCVSSEGRR
jgi:hypothetical protein